MTSPDIQTTIIEPNKTIVITSGYWNPLHEGHLDYLEAARTQGDFHICIVNNDEQVRLKGSNPFMNELQRLRIISALRCVNLGIISIDVDRTVCSTIIRLVREFQKRGPFKWVFCKGGDRNESNIPEANICRDLGIQMTFDVGGGKTQSSSELIRRAHEREA